MSELDPLEEFINTDRDTNIAYQTLRYHILGDDVDEATLGPETLKLRKRLRKRGIENFHITLAPEFRGTEEDIAKTQNDSEDWLDNPYNNLISRIGGHLFLLKDYVVCTENRKQWSPVVETYVCVPMTDEEKKTVREYKEQITLFEEAVQAINNLRGIYK